MPCQKSMRVLASGLMLSWMTACATVASADDPEHGPEHSWTKYSYEPYPLPYYVEDPARYPAAEPPLEAVNRHGELEYIGDAVFGVHWFVEVQGATWHFVTAGGPSKEA